MGVKGANVQARFQALCTSGWQGLGKTVQALALIATLPAPAAFLQADQACVEADASARLQAATPPTAAPTKTLAQFLSTKEAPAAVSPIPPPGKLRTSRATLVVCPMSLLSQWEEESKTHLRSVKTLLYHGLQRACTLEALCDGYDIVITT